MIMCTFIILQNINMFGQNYDLFYFIAFYNESTFLLQEENP